MSNDLSKATLSCLMTALTHKTLKQAALEAGVSINTALKHKHGRGRSTPVVNKRDIKELKELAEFGGPSGVSLDHPFRLEELGMVERVLPVRPNELIKWQLTDAGRAQLGGPK